MSYDDTFGRVEQTPQVEPVTGSRLPLLLEPETITPGDPNALQQVLYHAANVQAYINENPKHALAVGIVVAGLSGPKGVFQLAVEQALSKTDVGQSLNSYLSSLNEAAGCSRPLQPANYQCSYP